MKKRIRQDRREQEAGVQAGEMINAMIML